MKRSIVDIRERIAIVTANGTDREKFDSALDVCKGVTIKVEPDFKLIDSDVARFKLPLVPGGRDCNGDYNIEVTVEPKIKKKFIYKLDGNLTPEEAEEIVYRCLDSWSTIDSNTTVDGIFARNIMNDDIVTIAESNLIVDGRDIRVVIDGVDTDGYVGDYRDYVEDVAYFAIDWESVE